MEKNCFDCRLNSFIKASLDNLDFVFPNSKLTPEALEKKKEVREVFLDGIHAIAKANKIK